MKKNVTFIAQSKGGTGKSFITYFIAKNKKKDSSIFIDLDKSTRTSMRLKSFLEEKRVLELSIVDENMKLDRELFLNIFESISKAKNNEWYADLGAPESDELRSFFENEVPARELKQILDEIDIELSIWVIIAGEDAFHASIQYYKKIKDLAGDYFSIVAVKNEGTFHTVQAQEVSDQILEELRIQTKKVGKMPVGNSSREIISLLSGQGSEENLSLAGKRSLRKITEEIKNQLL